MRAAVDSEMRALNRAGSRILLYIVVVIVPASSLWDWLVIRPHFALFAKGRAIITAVVLGLIFLERRLPRDRYGEALGLGTIFLVGSVTMALLHAIGSEHPYYAMLGLTFIGTTFLPWHPARGLACCSALLLTYVVPPFFLVGPEIVRSTVFINNAGFLFETLVIVVAISFALHNRRVSDIVQRLTIEQQTAMLEARDRHKREFIANITHELKTPVSVVIGTLERMIDRMGGAHPDLADDARLVQRAALKLTSHVDRIIAVANIDDPEVKLCFEAYDLRGVVRNVFTLFEGRAKLDGVAYGLTVPEAPLVAAADLVHLDEALINLIENAFKFTPKGGRIDVSARAEGASAVVEVTDTGVGIPESRLPRIFERMFQADDVLSKKMGGLGLGLYLVRRAAELHGGSVSVRSAAGEGATFELALPLSQAGAPKVLDEAQSLRIRASQADRDMAELATMAVPGRAMSMENAAPAKPGVLVVEDDPGMMSVVAAVLSADYNVLLATDAFEAVSKLERYGERISLILSDVMMPGMSGFDLARLVMGRRELRHIPLVFVSALMSEKDQLQGYALGAADFVTKPFSGRILKEKVDHWVARREHERLLERAIAELDDRSTRLAQIRDIIIHELKNPLTVVGASVELLRRDEKNRAEHLERLGEGLRSVKDVLDASRELDLDRLSSQTPEDPAAMAREAAELVGHLLDGVTLDVDVAGALGTRVSADRRLMVQVLVNVLRNAVESVRLRHGGPAGRVRLSVGREGEGQVALCIADNGEGMDDATLDNLFVFHYSTKRDGSGIGLHLSKTIVRLHGGRILVDSVKGEGTSVRIVLPTRPEA